MSPLTKLFVVLLVVLSLLSTAATVVFVNQMDHHKEAADAARLAEQRAKTDSETQRNAAAAMQASAEASVRQATAQQESVKQELNRAQQQIVDLTTQLARSKSQQDIQAVAITTLTGTLKGSEDTRSRLQDLVNELRTGSDKLVTQNAQLNQTVTDLTSRLDVTERERKLLAEQLADAKGQVERQGSILREMGVAPAQLASSAGSQIGSPPLNGVIRDIRPIQGILYAKISIGSAESVVRGMEFKVVNRESGAFLGTLTIDTVEQNEAAGRLKGPRVGEIRPGAEVKTQL